MSWEDYERARRNADRDKDRQAWILAACMIAALVLVVIAKGCA